MPKTGTYSYNILFNKTAAAGNGGINYGVPTNYSDIQNGNYQDYFTNLTNGWVWRNVMEARNDTQTGTFSGTAGQHLVIFAGTTTQTYTVKAFTLKLSVN